MTTSSGAPAGWYPDSHVPGLQRYWDGVAWTSHTAPIAPSAGTASPVPVYTIPAAPVQAAQKRSLPTWAWIVIAVVALGIGLILSPVFAVLYLIVLITGVVGLTRNSPTWLRFRNRKVAAWVTAVSAVAFVLTGSVANAVLTRPAENEAVAFADIPSPSATPSTTPKPTPTPTPTPTDVAVTVTAVTDGDTIETSAGPVRLIGIDAPEQGAWGYAEAAAELGVFLATGPVTLVTVDGRDDTDRYGRLLRYVNVGGQDAGTHMIDTGWAIAKYDGRDGYGAHPLQTDYITRDAAHEMPAQPAPEPAPVQPEPVPAPVEPAPAEPAPVAPATDPQFRTCGDANDNGYGNYQAGVDPEYAWYQDRDNDGWVCEF
jgi:endonuclease YncB( thermonuclease family)